MRVRGCGVRTAATAAFAITVAAALAVAAPLSAAVAATPYSQVTPGHVMRFPEDLGSHPQYRTEWWYVTGWLDTDQGESLGFQITFFRTRPSIDDDNPSAFTPHQLLIAHCAISDPKRQRLWQDQRIRRAGLGLAEAKEGDTEVRIDSWTLAHRSQAYRAMITADTFSMALTLQETQAVLINGQSGLSRKGPEAPSSSYYYSLPHLRVEGSISRQERRSRVTGEAWFDHEWSSEYLDPRASGWDWIGINLDDGGALMAFQIRDLDGKPLWAGGSVRGSDGKVDILAPAEVQFRPQRHWTSARTGIRYPVQWQVQVGGRDFELEPLMDDQENDTRFSTGAIYWEGAVRAMTDGKAAGRGYLELTGYGQRLSLR